MIVKFTESEAVELNKLAAARNDKNDGVRSRKLGVSNDEAHRLGVWSEAAVAKFFGIDMNTEVFKDGGDKHAPDFHVESVGHIEVKCVSSTYNSKPWLKVPIKTFNDKVDYFVIVSSVNYTERTVKIYGYATRDEVKSAEQAKCIANGPLNYIIKDGFHDIQKLGKGNYSKEVPEVGMTAVPTVAKAETNTSNALTTYTLHLPFKQKEASVASTITESKYKAGDVVKLNSGGPPMSVVKVRKTFIKCIFFTNDNNAVEVDLPEESLVRV
jgi:uncharacterized protein YodC (DUF2158 family)